MATRREARKQTSRAAPESHVASVTVADTAQGNQPREGAGNRADKWEAIAFSIVAAILGVIYTEVNDLRKDNVNLRDRIAEATASAKDTLHQLDKQQAEFNLRIEQKLNGLEQQIEAKKMAKRP